MSHGLFSTLFKRTLARIGARVHADCDNIFGRNIPDTSHAPFDLRDSEGNYAISADGKPLVHLLKAYGDGCEIAYGNASLVETVVLLAHPVFTLLAELAVASGLFGVEGFVLVQFVYAVVALAALGRNWKYVMRPTVTYTLGLTTLQVLASWWLGATAAPFVAVANVLMLARPFLEPFLNNQDGSNRPFASPAPYTPPNVENERKKRSTQMKNALKDDAGPIIVLGTARGDFKTRGDPMSPDEGKEMAISTHDMGQHMFILGKPGSGKTGLLLPLAQQYLTLGTVKNGVWRNAGGAMFLCGKGVLPRDIITPLREQGFHHALDIKLISPKKGEHRMALLKGMSPNQIARAIEALNTTEKGQNIFNIAAGVRLRRSAVLLKAAEELEWGRGQRSASRSIHHAQGMARGADCRSSREDTARRNELGLQEHRALPRLARGKQPRGGPQDRSSATALSLDV